MTRTNTPAEDAQAAKSRAPRPEEAKEAKEAARDAHADAAKRVDGVPAHIGAEIAGEDRAREDTETADALKRAAENDRRS